MKYTNEEKLTLVIELILSWKIKDDIDDTLIQKFLTIIQDQGLEAINFDVFNSSKIQEKIEQLSSFKRNPQALAFALQLSAILLPKNITLKVLDLIEVSTIKSYEAVVRDSFWRYLTVFCDIRNSGSHNETETTKLIHVALSCLNDESLFVRRSVETFLIKCVKRVDEKEWIVLELLNGLKNSDYREGCVNCLYEALESETSQQVTLWNEKLDLIEPLLLALYSNKRTEIICKTLAIIAAGSAEMEESIQKKLVTNENFLEIISFSYFIIAKQINDKNDSLLTETNINTLISPMKLRIMINNSEKANLSKLEELLSIKMVDKALFRNILIKSLSCLSKLVPKIANETKLTLLDLTLNLIFNITSNWSELRDHKLLSSAINVISHLVKETEFQLEDEKVVNLLLKLLENSSVNSSLYHSCSTIISVMFELKYKQHLENSFTKFGADFWSKLGKILTARTLDIQWEIRDSSLEIISKATQYFKEDDNLSKWIREYDFHLLIWDLILEDEVESYIRATSLSILVYLCNDPDCWRSLEEKRESSVEKVSKSLTHLLTNDPEAFVQRAAVKTIGKLLKSEFLRYEMVWEGIYTAAMLSLDWEVKLEVLDIVEEYLSKDQRVDKYLSKDQRVDKYLSKDQRVDKYLSKDQRVDKYLSKDQRVDKYLSKDQRVDKYLSEDQRVDKCLLNGVEEYGIFQVLLKLVKDCDRPVKLKAAIFAKSFLVELKQRGINLPQINDEKCNKMGESSLKKQEIQIDMPKIDLEVVESVLDQEMRDKIKFLINHDKNKDEIKPSLEINEEDWSVALHELLNMDYDAIIIEAEKSTDLYFGDMDHILDDILAAVTHNQEESDSESQIIDCY